CAATWWPTARDTRSTSRWSAPWRRGWPGRPPAATARRPDGLFFSPLPLCTGGEGSCGEKSMAPLRMGVIGVGHLGKEHARVVAGLPGVELVGVADVNAEQAQAVARRLGTRAFVDYRPLLDLVEAVSVVVPTTQHAAVAGACLARGLPVLVEKPLAASPAEAEGLVALARRAGVPLQVGHIERFNPAFEELQGRPLQPKFTPGERLGGFPGRSLDIGAVFDLMTHDLDLVLALVRAPVVDVQALGVSLFGGHEDMAQARLRFADGCVADLAASRVSPAP